MSLFSDVRAKLTEKAGDLIDDKGEDWLDKVIEEGRDLADEHGDKLEGGKDTAHQALDEIEKTKTPLLRLGKVAFAHVLAAWGDDDKAEARRNYLAHQATYAERRAAMQAAGDAAAEDRDERIAAWEEVEATLKTIGTIGLKFLVKLVAGSVGVPVPL